MITHLTAAQLSQKLSRKELSVGEVIDAYFNQIEKRDAELGCFLTLVKENALKQVCLAQQKIDAGEAHPLTGVPIALKDNISTAGIKTTCASRILENYIPPYDAGVVKRLYDQGMILLGKTNLDEFAMGTSCENSAFFPTKNPWDTTRVPGGSSGGSAAAVAGRLSPLALGSDTGGSIRLPAALCGIVGFKPTYGRCSRYGLVSYGSSLDQIGPLARTVEDIALLSEVITGHDSNDSTSLDLPSVSSKNIKNGTLKGLKFALPKQLFGPEIQPGVASTIEKIIDHLQKAGVEFKEVSLDSVRHGVSAYYIIAPAEASSNLSRFDGVRFGPRIEGEGHIDMVAKTRGSLFGHEVKQRIIIGTYVLSAGYHDAYYNKAQALRIQMTKEYEDTLKDCDAVFSPTSPTVAFKIGQLHDPLTLKQLDFCTIPANMGGFPALSLCCGYSEGLPAGLQLLAPREADEKLLQMAYSIEQELASLLPSMQPPLG